jgi:hypothetical protein
MFRDCVCGRTGERMVLSSICSGLVSHLNTSPFDPQVLWFVLCKSTRLDKKILAYGVSSLSVLMPTNVDHATRSACGNAGDDCQAGMFTIESIWWSRST